MPLDYCHQPFMIPCSKNLAQGHPRGTSRDEGSKPMAAIPGLPPPHAVANIDVAVRVRAVCLPRAIPSSSLTGSGRNAG